MGNDTVAFLFITFLWGGGGGGVGIFKPNGM